MAKKNLKQSEYFTKLEAANGTHVALFLMCGMCDVPLDPMLADADFSKFKGDKWAEYLRRLKAEGKDKTFNGKEKGFLDGVCELKRVFGKDLTETDFAKYITYEKMNADQMPGTEEQRRVWGQGDLAKGLPFSDEVYHTLDDQREIWLERYKGYNAPQLDSNIITICKYNLIRDHLIQRGAYAEAQKVQKMVDDLMASEQMRKKDEKPVEHLQMDTLTVQLEKAGLMESGDFKTFPEVVDAIIKNFVKKRKYDQTIDAADKALAVIYNTIRGNEDFQNLFVMPNSMELDDEWDEFADEPSEEEKKRARFVGIPKVQYEDKQ